MSNSEKENVHKGHREVVRQRFIKTGNLDGFAEHEILELLLFYAYPMKDTNVLAHRIVNEYGSLYKLMNDNPANLMHRLNISENTAVLLSVLPYVFKAYNMGSFGGGEPILGCFSELSKYMTAQLINETEERVFVIYLNAKKRMLKAKFLSSGMAGEVYVSTENLIREALSCRARYVVLGHNHPGGSRRISKADYYTTKRLIAALSQVNIELMDHIVVCSSDAFENTSVVMETAYYALSRVIPWFNELHVDMRTILRKFDYYY